MRIKLPSIGTIIILVIAYNMFFDEDDEDKLDTVKIKGKEIVEQVPGSVDAAKKMAQDLIDKAKSILEDEESSEDMKDYSRKTISEAKERINEMTTDEEKEESIANPIDVSVFEGKPKDDKNEKLISEPSNKKSKQLETLEIPSQPKTNQPVFKSID